MTKRKTTALAANFERTRECDLFVSCAFDVFRVYGNQQANWVHTVYSGFNQAFRQMFRGADPIVYTNGLRSRELIEMRPTKGGMIYRPCDGLVGAFASDEHALVGRMNSWLENFQQSRELEMRERAEARLAAQAAFVPDEASSLVDDELKKLGF